MESLNKKFTLNRPQLLEALWNASEVDDISSRAVGKSTAIGQRIKTVAETMPRSSSVISSDTYASALTITLLPVFSSLSRLGWKRNVHYTIGRPLSNWKNLPFEAPADWSKFITFKTGAGFHIASQDREGSNRGRNVDHVIGDEMLKQNRKRFEDEVLASNRGNDDYFGRNPLHHGVYKKSSMPTGNESMWLLEAANYYELDGHDIWTPWNQLCKMQLMLIDSDDNNEKEELIARIVKQRDLIRYYPLKYKRDGKERTRIFTCYNVFDNIKNVGVGYIRQLRRSMTDLSFRVEVLNERITQIENGFYKLTDRNYYTKYDYGYIDNLDFDWDKIEASTKDSRRDGDVERNSPMHIAIDYGAHINAGWNAQPQKNEVRWLKTFFVKYPLTVEDWVNSYCDYYQPHKNKTVYHYYDHTAIGKDNKYQVRTADQFRKRGWNYVDVYVGHTPDPEPRYQFWDILLTGKSASLPDMQFNKDNCKEGLMSMQLAGIRQGEKGFKKDKRSEASKIIPREQATDFSDAADILIYGMLKNKFRAASDNIGLKFY